MSQNVAKLDDGTEAHLKTGGEQITFTNKTVAGSSTTTACPTCSPGPDADSRYAIFDYEFTTYDGRPTNKLFFLSWFPNNATPYSKMAYTQAKSKEEESDQEFGDDDF
ncbi:hypothetical protein JL721_2469 [Aureococcus anophagefferens]|nr:hypothetical protein JL721_2469 [Aureococcus anophagefferens]